MDALDWSGLIALGFAAGMAGGLSTRVLELAFAAMQIVFAWQLAKKAGLR